VSAVNTPYNNSDDTVGYEIEILEDPPNEPVKP
jgi:hypothetical protein